MPDSIELQCDQVLIEKIQAGNHAAFTDLFRSYHPRMCSFAWRYVKSEEVAKDLVQEIFLNIWHNRESWSPEGTVRSYLYRCVRNQAINHYKHLQVRDRSAEEIVHIYSSSFRPTPLESLSYRELEAHIRRSIKQLPDRRRLIFTLNRVDGLTYDEIACTLDISVNTVHTQMKRALAFLRDRLCVYRSEMSSH